MLLKVYDSSVKQSVQANGCHHRSMRVEKVQTEVGLHLAFFFNTMEHPSHMQQHKGKTM